MNLKSGISKELKKAFVLDENALIRVKGVMDKATETLNRDVRVVFHVEREDDRFFESLDMTDVLADPNITGKKVKFVAIEIRDDAASEESKRDWIARVVFLGEKRWGYRFKDTDEIHMDIATEDKNWALLLADELEPQILRTINRSKIPRWPMVGLFVVFLYGVARLVLYFNEKFPAVKITAENPIVVALAFAIGLPLALYLTLSAVRGELNWVNRLLGPETVFLWGEEEKRYPEREQTRKNLFWGVAVAFAVSLVASVLVAFL